MTKFSRNSYTFREGLTMMAAKALGIDPDLAVEAGESATAVMNLIRHAAKLRGPARDAVLHDAERELRRISHRQHPELVEALHGKMMEVAGHGRASVNPATGAEEFFWPFDQLKNAATRVGRGIGNVFGIGSARAKEPESNEIEPIFVTATRRSERLSPPSGIEPIEVSARNIGQTVLGIPYSRNSISQNERNDASGLGSYGTRRVRPGGTIDIHHGVDIEVPGTSLHEPILSGIDGEIVARNKVYKNPKTPLEASMTNVHVRGTGPWAGLKLKYNYVTDNGPQRGQKVVAGETPIGYYQFRHLGDSSWQMKPHVHLEAKWHDREIDPALILPNWRSRSPRTK